MFNYLIIILILILISSFLAFKAAKDDNPKTKKIRYFFAILIDIVAVAIAYFLLVPSLAG
ncbi:MAG TPA: hypothetical protein DD638_06000 [Pasteurellaceae bacterium]|nr:hypothetical protein [Pasteurellaceae bacterium]